jgi:hypothetical protein
MLNGNGLFFRDTGKFPPNSRKIIDQVKDEKITSLKLFRKAISLSKFAKFIGALKGTSFDELLHLGLVINGKYLLDKQSVLNFERSGVPSGAETQDVTVDKDVTISELLEKTRKRMGDANFSNYSSRKNNCQDFMLNVLGANGLSSSESTNFIKQDTEKVFNNLPSYAEAISDFTTGAQALVNRQLEGEGSNQMYNFQLHRSRCIF